MKTFLEYITQEKRRDKKELKTLKKVLENDFKVKAFLEDSDPYIFVKSNENTSFGGIRIYKIGNKVAYRVQQEEDTHPYGKAYLINVEDIFSDLISDMKDEIKAGTELMKIISEDIKSFFNKSLDAEKGLDKELDSNRDDPLGKVIINTQGTDYSNLIFNKK